MRVSNLAELKRYLESGRRFRIAYHFIKPELIGQTRVVSKMQSNGFYSVCIDIKNEIDEQVNSANGGKGFWCQFGKAKDYEFNGNLITQTYNDGNGFVWQLELLDFYENND